MPSNESRSPGEVGFKGKRQPLFDDRYAAVQEANFTGTPISAPQKKRRVKAMKGMRDASGEWQWSGEGDPNDTSTWVPVADAAPTGDGGFLGSTMGRVLKGMKDPIDAGAQLLPRGLEQLTSAFGAAPNRVSEFFGNEAKRVDTGIQASEQEYQAAKQAAGVEGIDWMRLAGSAVPTTAALVAGGGIPATGSLLGRVGVGAASGAALTPATTPVTEPTKSFAQEKLKQAAMGAAAGGVLPVVASGVSRVVKPTVSSAVEKLRAEGVFPTVGQVKGGMTGRLEEKLMSTPVSGEVIRSARKEVEGQLNTAAWNRALFPLKDKLPKGLQGHEAAAYVDDTIDAAYAKAIAGIKPLAPDKPFVSEVSTLGGTLRLLPKDRAEQYQQIVQTELVDRFQSGRLTGEGFKAAEANIGQLIRDYTRHGDADQRQLANALRELQVSMRSWLGRAAGPEKAKELANVNAAYKSFLRPLKATTNLRPGSETFTPGALDRAVKATDPSKHNKAYGTGSAVMQDLSSAGKQVLSDTVPNSGTTDRALLQYILSKPIVGAVDVAGSIPLALLYSSGGRKLAGAISRRPQLATPLAEILRQSGAYTAPQALQLLRQVQEEETVQ